MKMKIKTIKDFNLKNKRVFVRCDFNVPLDSKGSVVDDFRIQQTIPTLKYLQDKGARLVLASHRSDDQNLTSAWLRLKKYLDLKEAEFLDNLRLNKGEEENDDNFAKELAGRAEIYINDAFGVCHRAHASVVGVPKYLPSGAGFLLEKEITALSQVLEKPETPLVVIIGGAKIESKAKVIDNFLDKADQVLIGGKINQAVKINSSKLCFAIDDNKGFDIGPETIKMFSDIIKKAKTIVWAGPLGRFEDPLYEKGTEKIAQEITKNKKAFKVAGGGDTTFALVKFGLRDKFDHVSTGGGAMLSFLSGEELPGLKALGYYD
ncbi:MAG: phosphoglycerate kinase [bacterium]|nr:phosphoglycerate kinase [bacterium]